MVLLRLVGMLAVFASLASRMRTRRPARPPTSCCALHQEGDERGDQGGPRGAARIVRQELRPGRVVGAARSAREPILEQRHGRRHSAARRAEERWTEPAAGMGPRPCLLRAGPLRTWTLHHGHCAERNTVSLWAAWVVRGQLGLWEMCVGRCIVAPGCGG